MFELEQRVLYDASPLTAVMQPNALDVVDPIDIADLVIEESVADGSLNGFANETLGLPLDDELSSIDSQFDLEFGFEPTGDTARQLVVIDSAVDDYEQLISSLDSSTQVLLLDANSNGVEQISQALRSAGHTFDAIHIVSHGEDGGVQLGNQWLNSDSLQAVASELAQWTHWLSSDADVLFYGCNLAETEAGTEFVESVAALTGADVAASDNLTGHESLGGDWDFEFVVGLVETEVAFSIDAQQNWEGTLATTTVTTLGDVVSADADLSSVAALNANAGSDGVISLREAIIASNANADADVIHLGAGVHTLSITGTGDADGGLSLIHI